MFLNYISSEKFFAERYSLKSVDGTELPYLLLDNMNSIKTLKSSSSKFANPLQPNQLSVDLKEEEEDWMAKHPIL